jgi:hypothetical protein
MTSLAIAFQSIGYKVRKPRAKSWPRITKRHPAAARIEIKTGQEFSR